MSERLCKRFVDLDFEPLYLDRIFKENIHLLEIEQVNQKAFSDVDTGRPTLWHRLTFWLTCYIFFIPQWIASILIWNFALVDGTLQYPFDLYL